MADEEIHQRDEPEKVGGFKVKTNLKAGTDPETSAAAPSTDPIIITGG